MLFYFLFFIQYLFYHNNLVISCQIPFFFLPHFFFFENIAAPPPGFRVFEKVLLMVQKKKKFARRAKTPAKLIAKETHVPQARSEFLRINDICSSLSRLYIVLYGGRPQAVVGVSLLISKQRSWYPKVPGEATVRNTFKKGVP